MRFRNKTANSVYRFGFERTPKDLPPESAPAPRAAELDNPYGRYYSTARSREDLIKNRKS